MFWQSTLRRTLFARTPYHLHRPQLRHAAKLVNTDRLVPASQQPITDEAARQNYAQTENKMHGIVDWFRKDCASSETRASGRVTPAILDPVRVKLPADNKEYRLDELATVGVREGTTLIITVFEEDSLKHVEGALYESKIPNIVPQRQDSRTIRIPIPKPTVEARAELFAAAQRKAEDARVQIRKHHQQSVKKGKYAKRTVEFDEFQKLGDRYITDIDKIVAQMKKAIGR